jgi:hypothetical protein
MLTRMVRTLLFLGSALSIIAFTLVSIRLVAVAHPVEPGEVTILERAESFANDGPLYGEPAHADDPALMPGFPFITGLLMRNFGPAVWVPRALALACLFALALLVAIAVRIETGNWTYAATSAGFLALGLNVLAAPPGVARPEPLMLVLVLACYLTLRLSYGLAGALSAAVFAAAAFFTDASAVWFIAAALFHVAIDDHERLLAFTLGLGLLVGGGYVLLSRELGPWFNFSAWGDPAQSLRWNPANSLQFVGDGLLGKLGVLTLATVLTFAMPVAPWRGKAGVWLWMGAAALVGGLLSTQTREFGVAAIVPCLVALTLVGPVSMQRVTGHLSAWPGSSRMGGQGVVLTALSLQFIMFFACALTGPRLLD